MDCLEGMKEIPDGSIDAIICDLPYEVLHKNNPNAQWDRIIPFEPLWAQYERVIKDNGAILLFCQGMFTDKLMLSNEKLWRYNLVWDKCRVTGFLNANRMPMRCHEDIAVFYKSLPTYNPKYDDGPLNHSRGSGHHKQTNNCYGAHLNLSDPPKKDFGRDYEGRTYDSVKRVEATVPDGKKLPRSIIAIQREHESTVLHPTQKPVELLRYLIRTFTNPGDVILDNCMGSGTTAIAAVMEKRKFIGFETDKTYYEKANARLKALTGPFYIYGNIGV